MSGLGGAISGASGNLSPDPTPSSAYVPSSSAPWMNKSVSANIAGTGITAGAAESSADRASGAGSRGSNWWEKHASTTDTQLASGWKKEDGGGMGGFGGGGSKVGFAPAEPREGGFSRFETIGAQGELSQVRSVSAESQVEPS